MRINKYGLELIKKWEGFSSKPYLCPAGIPTIGYGSTYYSNGNKVSINDKSISESDAELLLIKTLELYEDTVYKNTINLNENQFSALVVLCYNIGPSNFKKSSLLKLIKLNKDDIRIEYEWSKWNKSNGKILSGLVKRRKEEYSLYKK